MTDNRASKLPPRPPAWFSLHARENDYRVTFHPGWLKASRSEQDEMLRSVFDWMQALVEGDREALGPAIRDYSRE